MLFTRCASTVALVAMAVSTAIVPRAFGGFTSVTSQRVVIFNPADTAVIQIPTGQNTVNVPVSVDATLTSTVITNDNATDKNRILQSIQFTLTGETLKQPVDKTSALIPAKTTMDVVDIAHSSDTFNLKAGKYTIRAIFNVLQSDSNGEFKPKESLSSSPISPAEATFTVANSVPLPPGLVMVATCIPLLAIAYRRFRTRSDVCPR